MEILARGLEVQNRIAVEALNAARFETEEREKTLADGNGRVDRLGPLCPRCISCFWMPCAVFVWRCEHGWPL